MDWIATDLRGDMAPKRKIILYGAAASGPVAVEAALALPGIPFRLIEGETLTGSAAILTWLADACPDARLAPAPHDLSRAIPALDVLRLIRNLFATLD